MWPPSVAWHSAISWPKSLRQDRGADQSRRLRRKFDCLWGKCPTSQPGERLPVPSRWPLGRAAPDVTQTVATACEAARKQQVAAVMVYAQPMQQYRTGSSVNGPEIGTGHHQSSTLNARMTNHASCRWFKPPENDVLQVNEEAWPWVLSVDVFRLPDETYDKWKALHPANSWPAEGYAMLINEADRIYLYDGAHIFLSCVDARVCAWVKRVRRSIDSQFLILPQALLEATVRKVGMGQGSHRGPLSINTCAGQS